MKIRLAPCVVAFVCLSPELAVAQPASPVRAPIEPIGWVSAPPSVLRTHAVPCPNGDRIVAFQYYGRLRVGHHVAENPSRRDSLALARIAPDGSVRWMRRFAQEARTPAQHVRVVLNLEPTPDGGGLLSGLLERTVSSPHGVLIRFGPAGNELWRLASSLPSTWTDFQPRLHPNGRLFVLGHFYRGEMQLPGAGRMRGQRRLNPFLAEVDFGTGQVRWQRRLKGRQSTLTVASDGSLLVAGWFQGHTGRGRHAVRSRGARDGVLSRFDLRGRMTQNVAWGTPHNDNFLGVTPLLGGGAVVLTDSYPPNPAGASPMARRQMRLVGYDSSLRRTFDRPLPQGWNHALPSSDPSDRVVVISTGPLQSRTVQLNPDGTVPRHGTMAGGIVRVHTHSALGAPLGSVDVTEPGRVFTRDVVGRRHRGAVLLGGVAADLRVPSAPTLSAFVTSIPEPGAVAAGISPQVVAHPRLAVQRQRPSRTSFGSDARSTMR